MNVALVHDHLIQHGGAEEVLAVLQGMYPKAPTYTLLYDQRRLGGLLNNQDIRTSFLQRTPFARKHYQWFLPLMPLATESYDLQGYDVVISSCSALAKGVITQSDTLHLCYCHTPTRYLWSDTHRYVDELRYPWLVKRFIPPMLSRLRVWDQLAAQRVDVFVANSKYVAYRIEKYYRRTSTVIHPPVQTSRFHVSNNIDSYYVTGGRLVAYKRFDIVIRAFNRLGIKLVVYGDGPERHRLEGMAKKNIQFIGHIDAATQADVYSRAIAFINPQVEDFGITPVESMASGRPVIAYNRGGATETVVEGKTGTFFTEQTWEALADCVVRFKPEMYESTRIKQYAEQFGVERFVREMNTLVAQEHQRIIQQRVNCH